MRQINVEEAAVQFLPLVQDTLKGEEVIIKNGEPIIKFITVESPKPGPRFGSAKHLNITMSEDFDEPLEDFAEYM